MNRPQGQSHRPEITYEQILQLRHRNWLVRSVIYVLMTAMMLWSVQVTIISDTDWERMGSIGKVMSSAARFVGIDWALFPNLIEPAIETFMIACLGTLLGVLICIPAAWFGAHNITPFKPVTYPLGRLLMTLRRSIHEIVWALFFVAALGLGALPGIFAIAVRSVGFIAKMSAEAIEDIDVGPIEAIRATGANDFQVVLYGIVPQVLPQVLGVIIFEWEINIIFSDSWLLTISLTICSVASTEPSLTTKTVTIGGSFLVYLRIVSMLFRTTSCSL